METLHKTELINQVAKLTDKPKSTVGEVLDEALDVIVLRLASGGRVSYQQFGTFSVKQRPPRKGRNPRTGEAIEIPAKRAIRFSPSSAVRERVELKEGE